MFPDSGRLGNMCAAPELEKLASASRLPAALVDLVFQIKCLVRDRPVRGVRGDSCLLMRILLVMEGDGCGGEARRRGDGGQQAVSK